MVYVIRATLGSGNAVFLIGHSPHLLYAFLFAVLKRL